MSTSLSFQNSPLNNLNEKMTVWRVTAPIFIEQTLRMSMMMIDVVMLSWFSEQAVAAIGVTASLVFFVSLLYMIVTTGCSIILGQFLGSQRKGDAFIVVRSGLLLTWLFAIIISLLFFFAAESLVSLYRLDEQVHSFAVDYAVITGGGSIGIALATFYSAVLRAHGYAVAPTIFSAVGGVLNILGNYIALFGAFGIEPTGVVGVAIATVLCQVVVALLCWIYCHYQGILTTSEPSTVAPSKMRKRILALGLPSAGEGISYNLSQLVITYFVSVLGTSALAATTIALILSRFIFVFSLSVGLALQILSRCRSHRR